MPFHLSVVALILLSVVETIGMYVGLTKPAIKKNCASLAYQFPLLNVKFSKALILFFYSSISVLPVIFYSFLSLLYSITLSRRFT
jgi:hypothetical protein